MTTPFGPPASGAASGPKPKFDYAAREQETVRLILRALKTGVERGRFTAEDAVTIAINQIFRPRGPRIPEDKKDGLERAIHKLATTLTPPSSPALYAFAKSAAALAWAIHPRPRSPLAPQEDAWFGSEELVRAALHAELAAKGDAFGPEDLVRRAVRRSLMTRRKARPGLMLPVKSGDPLRDLLDVPLQGFVRLPGRDIRSKMAVAFTRENAMGAAVRKASIFHSERMEKALGAELWALGRPVGFADKKQSRLLIASPSSTAAQETQLRSRELLHRLQLVAGLEKIIGVKVHVDASAYHLFTRDPG